jgi:tetrahydromethanopterin S-methyltransferase subunit F
MKSILLTLLLVVMSLPFHAQKGIPCASVSIPDSCGVLYTHKQDERCLLTFIKCERQDSLIALYDEQIKRADSIMYDQLNTINEQEDELKRRRKNVYKGTIVGSVSGFLIGVMSFGLVLLNGI